MTTAVSAILLLATIALLSAGTVQAFQTPRYVTEDAGINHVYDGGWEFFVGGGLATFDCDADGREDLYIAGGSNPAALFRNVSETGGAIRFDRMDVGPGELTEVTGAYPLDIDGDYIIDLAVLRVGENKLLRGLGGCRFESANFAWGFGGGNDWTTAFSARWDEGADWPTLFVGNYVDRDAPGSPFGTCASHHLWHPKPGGGFAPALPLEPGYCNLSALFSDWNRDGSIDLRLTNDRQYYSGGQEQLWRIPATGKPSLYSRSDGWRKLTIWGMGIATHDVTDDGLPDYFLTSMGDNKLRVLTEGKDRPVYGDEAGRRGMTAHRPYTGGDILPSTGWHPEFKDVNNDGTMDLFITKGNVEAMKDFAARDPNTLLMGRADGSFVDVGEQAGIVTFARGRGASLADFNLDGLPDLVVVNRREPVEVWRNVGAGSAERPVPLGNWLQLKLRQDGGNRNAVGAWIEVRIGARTLNREVTIGGGHGSGHHGWLHFGVGTAERARARVRWPDGEWGPWVRLYTNQFARGANALIVLAWDSDAVLPAISRAQAEGIPVLGYDRLIEAPGVFYLTFDNVEVGRMQARAVHKVQPKGNYVFIKGAPTDPNADFLHGGQLEVLQAAIDSGDIKVVGEQYTDAWLPENAQRNMEQILTANNNAVDAVVASNDGTAGGVVAALTAQGMEGIPVSGQDGDHAALNRVARGWQTVSVWKDARELGQAAGGVAVKLANGEPVDGAIKWSGGTKGVEMDAILLPPIPITHDNLDVVIDAGWVAKDVVCQGVGDNPPAACK